MKKYSVMIVDDNQADRYLLKRYLTKSGVVRKVFEASHGGEALKYFEEYEVHKKASPEDFPPILLFLDINMPRVDGFEFLEQFKKLREKVAVKSVVVMMFTSSAHEKERVKALSYDFVKDFITKGEVDSDMIKEKILRFSES